MAFKIHHTKDGSNPAWLYLPMAAATHAVGDVAVVLSGNLTLVSSGSGQDTDEGAHYVIMGKEVVGTAGAVGVPCVKANPNIVWETTLGEASTNTVAVGLTYGVHTDGKTANSVLTKGCFTLETLVATTINSVVTGVLV